MRLGRFMRAMSLTGFAAMTPRRTAKPSSMLRIVRDCLACEIGLRALHLQEAIDPGHGHSRTVKFSYAGITQSKSARS